MIRVQLGSSLWALYLHTTLVYVILLRQSWGISSCRIIRNVSVPSRRCCLGPLETLPIPWHRRPSSLEYYWFQVFLYLGWRHSWRCSRVSPVTVSMTGMAQLWMNASGEFSMGCLPGDYVNLLSELLGVDLRTYSSSDWIVGPLDRCSWCCPTCSRAVGNGFVCGNVCDDWRRYDAHPWS